MIQSFQKFSQSRVAKIFLAILALSFVAFFGGSNWLPSRDPHGVIAEVGSETIDHRQFAEKVHQRAQLIMTHSQEALSRENLLAAGLPQMVLSQLVQENLLNLEAAHLGLTVSDEAIRNYIHSLKAFQAKNGKFDRALFAQILRSNGLSEDAFISNLRQELIREQLIEAIVRGAYLPDSMVARLFNAQYQTRQASMLLVSPKDIPAPPLPSEKVLEAFYKEHQKQFALPELRSFTVLTVDPNLFAKDVAVTDKDIEDLYAAKQADFQKKPLKEVKPLLLAEIQKEKALEQAYQLTQQLDDKIAGGATLEDITTSSQGVALLKVSLIDAQGRAPLQEGPSALPQDKDLVQDILQTGFGLETDTDSPFSQSRNGSYYMIRVDKINLPALPAFKDIKNRVQKAWIQVEQFKAAKNKAEAYVNSFNRGDRKASLMARLPNLSLALPSPDVQNEVKNLVFSLRPHQTATTITPKGIAVVTLNAIALPEEKVKEKEMASFKESLLNSYKDDLLVAYLNALRIRYTVKINAEAIAALFAPKEPLLP
jgi:peptidyl-prolyl cis-trans isomerase D